MAIRSAWCINPDFRSGDGRLAPCQSSVPPRPLLCLSVVINGPFRWLKDFVEVGFEIFSHPRQPVDQAMRVCLRLSDQDSLTSIGVATLSNIARVGNPGIVLENVSAVHHLLK